jgi:hypothetical protein
MRTPDGGRVPGAKPMRATGSGFRATEWSGQESTRLLALILA